MKIFINAFIKRIFFKGASNGIDLELTKILLKDGWIVFGIGRDKINLENTRTLFPQFIPIQADFTRNANIERAANIIKNSGLPLHLSVQNAGMKSPPRPLIQYTCESIDEVFFVNLLAPMKLTALLAQQMPNPESSMSHQEQPILN